MMHRLSARSAVPALALLGLPLLARDAPAPAPDAADGPATEVPSSLSAADWSSIREAWETARHAAQAIPGGFRTRTPGQDWTTEFDRDGATTTPATGDWRWTLELASWGFEGALTEVERARSVTAAGQRVSLDWDERLTEWWINDTRGLEHGFTVRERPEGAHRGGPLRFALDVRGGLQPRVDEGRRSACFVGPGGATRLTYSGLVAFDARGQDLEAWMEVVDRQLVLQVDESRAVYPITIDPIVQTAYLKASNTDGGDEFGVSLDVCGDTVVIGAPGEDSAATGVNGGPNAEADNSAMNAGAAYVFTRSGATWTQQAYLKASNAGEMDEFGCSVAIFGDTVVVGALFEDSSATGVNGGASAEADDSARNAGAAYVFTRSGTTWSQQAYLKASNTDEFDFFGLALDVFEDTIVVGAHFEDSSATGVNGGAAAQADDSARDAGAVYVFTRNGTVWSQEAYIKPSNTDAYDQFGQRLALSGDELVVGAPLESSSATGVNGGPTAQADNSLTWAGAAYLFTRSGSTWSQEAYFKASNAGQGDRFGTSVAISGESIVVGAYFECSSATGVNAGAAAEADDSATRAGAAYVFTRRDAAWAQEAYLKASNTYEGDHFGGTAAIEEDTIIVGAAGEDSGAAGVNGGAGAQADNSASGAGAAYVFTRSGATWGQAAYLKASNTGYGDRFGLNLAIAGEAAVIGAYRERSGATGVNGGPAAEADDSAFAAGAAYVFDLSGIDTIGTTFCPSSPNSTGVAGQITATGSTKAADNDLTLTASGLPFGQFSIFVTSTTQVAGAPVGAGVLCLGGQVGRYFAPGQILPVDPAGEVSLTLDLNRTPLPASVVTVMSGESRSWQAWYRDFPVTGVTSNFTTGVTITFE